ncbi:four helix bundle protein [Ulvibacter sp. MAR_2010_11]|uniref:four helix bundle protein n=1 Tax=Ulvibacter sp. MAR_2010_11 TaxID=1250229 RepID=UPI000C2CDDB1|nr:four helix bundle protein [Ulvibacter sp. MAR_2010_11]PKA82480.1 four helix bundle protein [Ulvibacter sp. MAR_2010_11]
MRDFKKYDVWRLSHQLTLDIYKFSTNFPNSELYGLSAQIRRAAFSIPTNISEGCGRDSDSEFNRFLTIALGSASETEYLILLSKDLNYIDTSVSEKLHSDINTIKMKIYSLKQKLN